MSNEPIDNPKHAQIANLRLQTIVAETKEDQPVTLRLSPNSGVQGFIVLLQPALPTIY